MKALTLTQPWATLVAIGAKRIETRSWSTPYRGPIAIHAARNARAGATVMHEEPFRSVLAAAGVRVLADLPRGAVIATAYLADVLPTSPRRGGVNEQELLEAQLALRLAHFDKGARSLEQELAFGDFSPGRFAWMLEDVVALPEPVPARGALGLWNWER